MKKCFNTYENDDYEILEEEMEEERFWYLVEKIGWSSTNYDYITLGYLLSNFINDLDELKLMRKKSKELQKKLITVFYQDGYKLLPGVIQLWGGDDSFWDFRAHIVGLGKEHYYSVMNDFSVAGSDYVENFDYVFQTTEEVLLERELRVKKLERVLKNIKEELDGLKKK